MLGVVNLDKPVGPTSHDMVGLLRRLTGTRRIGHAGTLDPLASGVLPILVGPATRFSAELTGGSKRYEATIRLGSTSLTDDAEGPIEPSGRPIPHRDAIESALATFVGTFDQRPPAFSARKQGGQVAHRSARAGTPIDLAPRAVTITKIDVVDVAPGPDGTDVRIDMRCAAGTYVRSLARDLGERLGCGGYLLALRRTEAAGLRADDAVSPTTLEELAGAGRITEAILPVGPLLPLRHVDLAPDAAGHFVHGVVERLAEATIDERVAVFGAGRLLGIGIVEAGFLRPDKVLPVEEPA